jgi:O-antigen/teichoic acid export membrane protein
VVLNGIAVAALYLMVRLSVGGAVAASLAGAVVTTVLVAVAIRERAVLRGYAERLRDAAAYARKRYLTEVASMLEMRVDIVMLGMLTTASATGVYSVAVAVVELLWFIPRAAETPLLSRMMREGKERGAELTAQAVRLTVVLEAVLLLGAALLLPFAIRLAFGPSFDGAVLLFWLLAPGVVLNGLAGPVISYLTSRGHQYPGLAAATVGGNIALNAALIPLLGGAGAALASSVTYAAGSLWLVARFMRETGVRVRTLVVPRYTDLRDLLPR